MRLSHRLSLLLDQQFVVNLKTTENWNLNRSLMKAERHDNYLNPYYEYFSVRQINHQPSPIQSVTGHTVNQNSTKPERETAETSFIDADDEKLFHSLPPPPVFRQLLTLSLQLQSIAPASTPLFIFFLPYQHYSRCCQELPLPSWLEEQRALFLLLLHRLVVGRRRWSCRNRSSMAVRRLRGHNQQ